MFHEPSSLIWLFVLRFARSPVNSSNIMHVGVESMSVYGGPAVLDVSELAKHRGLDTVRFGNLLMKQKTVALPCEGTVSFGVNAARPLVISFSPRRLPLSVSRNYFSTSIPPVCFPF